MYTANIKTVCSLCFLYTSLHLIASVVRIVCHTFFKRQSQPDWAYFEDLVNFVFLRLPHLRIASLTVRVHSTI